MKKRRFITMLFIMGVLFGMSTYSCKKKDKNQKTDTSTVPSGCDTSGTITYGNFVQGVLSSNCTSSGCHGSGSGNGDFTNYSGIKAKVNSGAFQARVLQNQDMPPSGSLSSCTLIKLQKWVDTGAQQ